MSPGPQVWGWARLPITKTDWYTGDRYNPGSPHLCFKAKAAPLPAALLCVLSHPVTSPQSNYIPTDTISPVPQPLWDAKLQTLGSSPSQGKPSFMAELQTWRFNGGCAAAGDSFFKREVRKAAEATRLPPQGHRGRTPWLMQAAGSSQHPAIGQTLQTSPPCALLRDPSPAPNDRHAPLVPGWSPTPVPTEPVRCSNLSILLVLQM